MAETRTRPRSCQFVTSLIDSLLRNIWVRAVVFVAITNQVTVFGGDCNVNSIDDTTDITSGVSSDCNANGVPDECELLGNDCNANAVPDDCEAGGFVCPFVDCAAATYRTLTYPGAFDDDLFGARIFVDGNRAVVTAPWRGTQRAGGIATYRFIKDQWVEEATIDIADESNVLEFAKHVDLDGDVLLAYAESSGCPAPGTSHVDSKLYFYRFDGVNWNQESSLDAVDMGLYDLGTSGAVSGDTAVVTTRLGDNTSKLVVLRRIDGEWVLLGDFADFQSGSYVDGRLAWPQFQDDVLVIARTFQGQAFPGVIHIYHDDGMHFNEVLRYDSPPNPPETPFYPTTVAIDEDADRIVVGEVVWDLPGSENPNDDNGRLFVFDRTDDAWSLSQILEAESTDVESLGWSIDVYDNRIVAGAPHTWAPPFVCDGSVNVYELNESWQLIKTIPCQPEQSVLGLSAAIGDGFILLQEINNDPENLGDFVHHYLIDDADCDGNGQADSCDVLGGVVDCDGNGRPDACEPFIDCDDSGVRDACELFDGLLLDCNRNGIPDVCDIADGTSSDCRGNGVPDECEYPDCNGNGVPDDCDIGTAFSSDCDSNGIPDECDTAEDPALDCNQNFRPDSCDMADGTSSDVDGDGIPDECKSLIPLADDRYNSLGTRVECTSDEDCFGESVCLQSVCYVPKNRFITWQPNPANANKRFAYRISMEAGVAGNVVLGYATLPSSSGVSSVVSGASMVDWIDYFADVPCEESRSNLIVADCEIVPGRRYVVQTIWEALDMGDESNYSSPLILPTVSHYGDAVGGDTPSLPPDGNANFVDILAAVGGFRREGVTLDTWLELDWLSVPALSISFVDVQQFVIAFQNGGAYPGTDPLDCP
ncbi:MAG: hypothetical protein ACPGXK_12705 [Phycisphaerae bacterium]